MACWDAAGHDPTNCSTCNWIQSIFSLGNTISLTCVSTLPIGAAQTQCNTCGGFFYGVPHKNPVSTCIATISLTYAGKLVWDDYELAAESSREVLQESIQDEPCFCEMKQLLSFGHTSTCAYGKRKL